MQWYAAAEKSLKVVIKRNNLTAEQIAAFRTRCEELSKDDKKVGSFVVYMLAPDGILQSVANNLKGGN